ncbi:glycerophosphodiester phosphodiesterase [Metabacillus sp. KIGAM252]|uniref:Glycerophosphodiester phosphodiesterase n=1 Tax=Metabacillus flavus TaxID=2823519 RepID=A0ABS5LFR2_9BACI|nr:glycerophosphodiester phosphodiesterase [Metabacillus flavus]MBS2969570.1 glycerophosphodiester phosphodiesterase [Metabacillus flavus]
MTLIFGHRGSAGTRPENTMISFKEAVRLGADGIELDVHLSKDQIPVVIHDETLDRTTNGSGFVKDYSADELVHLDASWKFDEYRGEANIPLLEEVLKWASESAVPFIINIELKNNVIEYSGLEEKVISLVKHFELDDRVILSSFNHSSMVLALKTEPKIETALLYTDGIYKPYEYARRAGARSIHPLMRTVKNELIDLSRENSISVRPFTVNDDKEMHMLFEWESDGFFTDYPGKAIEIKKSIK